MVLLHGLLVLLCCLLALVVSAYSLGNPPFGILGNSIFLLTELVVQGWFIVLENLHRWGNWASFSLTIDWEGPSNLFCITQLFWALGDC